jgi:hypothetical protein
MALPDGLFRNPKFATHGIYVAPLGLILSGRKTMFISEALNSQSGHMVLYKIAFEFAPVYFS